MAITTPVYCTRNSVKSAMDVATTARIDQQIDRLIQASARHIEQAANRVFYPMIDTRYFDWPTNLSGSGGRPWQVWLDANELISLTAVTAGSVPLNIANINAEPVNYGPPYTHIEVNLAASVSFVGGQTWQRAVSITGLWGFQNAEVAAGALGGSINGTQATITVTDSSAVAPGALIRADSERMLVADAAMASTGVSLIGSNTASANDVSLNVGGLASSFAVGETILLDAERMLIVDISGTSLIVKRAWDGSVIGTHSGSAISALRSLTVIRGALGTTTAAHSAAAPLYRHTPPALVEQANVGLTLYKLGLERGGVRPIPLAPAGAEARAAKRTASPVEAMMDDLVQSYGRQARTRCI